jgi:ribosomal protein S18 acetylase RimI-like enzyme
MEIKHYTSVATFLAECGETLSREPAKHSLMLGLLLGLKETSKPNLLFSVEQEGRIQVCGLQTEQSRPLILGFMTDQPNHDFILSLRSKDPKFTSIVGAEPTLSLFANAWCEVTGLELTHRVDQTLFELKEVHMQGLVDQSTVKPAGEKDRQLIKHWITAFQSEALPNEPFTAQAAADYADSVLAANSLYLLSVASETVAMAAIVRPTSLGASINAVYTPPSRRKKGFASTLVAKLCQQILHDGKERCWLYADKSNPTANHIYVNIGFRPVCDCAHITFNSGS